MVSLAPPQPHHVGIQSPRCLLVLDVVPQTFLCQLQESHVLDCGIDGVLVVLSGLSRRRTWDVKGIIT